MIFLTAFSQNILVPEYQKKRHPGQFFEEYKYLLKTIFKIYPDATPILYIFEGKINSKLLKDIHPKLIIFDWNSQYNERIGIDLNNLKTLMATMDLFDEPIIMLDTDCLIIKRFDEYIQDDVDITAVTRGFVKWNGDRHDLIFAPAIYHNHRPQNVRAYISKLFKIAHERGFNSGDWWPNVQAAVNDIFLEAQIDLRVDYDGFPSRYGQMIIDSLQVNLKVTPQFVLGYPIQDEKFYDETRIIHYKTHKTGNDHARKLFEQWSKS